MNNFMGVSKVHAVCSKEWSINFICNIIPYHFYCTS